MATEITIPRLGWSMDEGTFGQWLKQNGEVVREGDPLFELESDKAMQEVESFDSGILRISPNGPQTGDTVRVGQRIAYLCKPGERAPFETAPIEEMPTEPTPEVQPAAKRKPDPPVRPILQLHPAGGRSSVSSERKPAEISSGRRPTAEPSRPWSSDG